MLEELSGRFRIHFDHALMFDEVYTVIKMVEKGNGIGIFIILAKCVLPYLVPDAVKLALALSISRRWTRFVPENA